MVRKVFLVIGLVQLLLVASILFGDALSAPFKILVHEEKHPALAIVALECVVSLLLASVFILQHRSFTILGFRFGMIGGGYLINEKESVDKLSVSFAQLAGQIKKQDTELRSNYKKAVNANKAKSDFLINISHELRTPMHAILNFAEIGQNKVVEGNPEKLKLYFSRIEESGERLLLLINRLLDLSSLEAGRHSFVFGCYDMRKCLDDSVAGLQSLVDHKGLKLVVEQQIIDTNWVFDKPHMMQVIVNLLSNAIKFSPENARIIVRLEKQKMQLDTIGHVECLCVSFLDEGVGIPEDEVGIIFEKFIQSSLNDHSVGGSGLGLPICREIVREHQGKIWAENNKDVGARVAFAIPLNLDQMREV